VLIYLLLRITQRYRDTTLKLLLLLLLLLCAIGLLPGVSGYFTCIQNMKLVTNKFKSRGLHEKHVVAIMNNFINCVGKISLFFKIPETITGQLMK